MKTPSSIRSSHWVTWGTMVRWVRKSLNCESDEIASEILTSYVEHHMICRSIRDNSPKYQIPAEIFN